MAVYERVLVDQAPDANYTGPVRARPPTTVAEIDRLRRGGVSMRQIAGIYGVSVRTLYRYLAGGPTYADVAIDGWTATFAVVDDRPPWRVSAWRRC